MKMLKKLLAVVLTGAMALTLLTACGGNAVTEKGIADALNDMAKAQAKAKGQDTYITFTPRAQEREMARQLAALLESKTATATVADGDENSDSEFEKAAKNILGCNKGGANENNFVWLGEAIAEEIGTGGQVYQFVENNVLDTDGDYAYHSQSGKTPANDRCMGTALCKVLDNESGKLVTVRIIVVTAAVDKK